MGERANPFGALDDFEPKTTPAKPVEPGDIDRLAAATGFPSRKPQPVTAPAAPVKARPTRRHLTGRNQQINIKATSASIERFYRMADERRVSLGELFELALDALEVQSGPT